MNPHIILVPTIIIAIITYLSAFDKNGKPTCDRYILNCYMYAITYLFFLTYLITYLSANNFKITENMFFIIGAFILNIISFLSILWIPKDNVLVKHLLSLVFISTSSVLLYIIFSLFKLDSIVFAVVLTLVLFIIISLFAWKFQDYISSKLSWTFVIIMFVMIIIELIIGMMYPGSMIEKAVIFVVLMIMLYLLLVKTKRMIEDEKNCIQNKGPDYVKESVSLVVSVENILIRILQLKGGMRSRR